MSRFKRNVAHDEFKEPVGNLIARLVLREQQERAATTALPTEER
ncbi:hypothetical protein [Streptomyces sp. XM4193]|nr:hypothetical protein [Streptomyces sp. XM4193]